MSNIPANQSYTINFITPKLVPEKAYIKYETDVLTVFNFSFSADLRVSLFSKNIMEETYKKYSSKLNRWYRFLEKFDYTRFKIYATKSYKNHVAIVKVFSTPFLDLRETYYYANMQHSTLIGIWVPKWTNGRKKIFMDCFTEVFQEHVATDYCF